MDSSLLALCTARWTSGREAASRGPSASADILVIVVSTSRATFDPGGIRVGSTPSVQWRHRPAGARGNLSDMSLFSRLTGLVTAVDARSIAQPASYTGSPWRLTGNRTLVSCSIL